jgi:hypothetical protein
MITGYFVYKGLTIMQHKDVATQFEKLILIFLKMIKFFYKKC